MPTEKQAADMWCPYARVLMIRTGFTQPTEQAPGYNRITLSREDVNAERGIHVVRETVDVPAAATCIGSRCMAWRIEMHEPEQHPGYKHTRMVRGSPDQECPDCKGSCLEPGQPAGGTAHCERCEGTGSISDWQPVGYCGLAGKPE